MKNKLNLMASLLICGQQIIAQNVGINVTNPAYPLTISSTNPSAGVIGLDNEASILAKTFGGGYEKVFIPRTSNNSTFLKYGVGGLFIEPIGATGNKILSMLNNGNVGIGTTNPADKLMVLTGTNAYGITHTSGTVTLGTYVGDTGGWLGTKTNHPLFFFTNDGSARMTITQGGVVGIGTTSPQPDYSLDVSGYTKLTNSPSNSNGNVGIGDVATSDVKVRINSNQFYGLAISGSSSTNGAMIHVEGTSVTDVARIAGTVTNGYNLRVVGSAGKTDGLSFWSLPSDARLKEQISPYQAGLADLVKIKPVKFHYTKASGMNNDKENIGVLAQDLQEIAPYMVGKKKKGESDEEYLDVNLSPMLFMYVNAFKEVDATLKAQAEQIKTLEALVKKLIDGKN